MMAALLLGVKGIACRACGAQSAPAPREMIPFSVCANCWKRFCSQSSGEAEAQDVEFNAWLARQIVLQVKRLERSGVLGRCEARSMAPGWPNSGYQCAHGAVAKRDGRLVCTIHNDSSIEITFIDEDAGFDPYADFADTLIRVARIDERLSEVLRSAASQLGSMNALGPEYPELVQRYAGYIQQAKDIEEIGALLMVFEQRVKSAVQDACTHGDVRLWDTTEEAGR